MLVLKCRWVKISNTSKSDFSRISVYFAQRRVSHILPTGNSLSLSLFLSWDIQAVLFSYPLLILIVKASEISIEPVGSVAPKVNFLERFKMMQIAKESSTAIFCPGQSFPVAVFRFVYKEIL